MTEPRDDAPRPTAADRVGEADLPGARMAALTAYLQTHADRFTPEALRGAALAAGYTADEVDAATRQLAAAAPDQDPSVPRLDARVAGLTFVGWVVGVWLGASALESLLTMGGDPLTVPVLPLAWVASGVVGTIVWATQRRRHPSLARGVGTAVVVMVLLPIVLFVALLGICLVAGTTFLGT